MFAFSPFIALFLLLLCCFLVIFATIKSHFQCFNKDNTITSTGLIISKKQLKDDIT